MEPGPRSQRAEQGGVFFASFRGYRVSWLGSDLLAGVLLAAIAIPTQIATAHLAGMPPATGLYASVAGALAFAVFGRNRFLSVGADSTIAPIFAATIAGVAVVGSQSYVALVGVMTLLVGAMLLAAGLLRAQWISDLLSIPVTVGFLAGIAVQIVISQVPALLGISVAPTAAIDRIGAIVRALPHVNLTALGLGVLVLAIVAGAKAIDARVPGALIALLLAASAVAFFHLQNRVALVGALHPTAPVFHVPIAPIARTDVERIIRLAVVVAVVCIVQTVTTLRIYRSETGIVDTSRDLAATGAGSLAAAFFGGFAVDASPPRTALVQRTGARSQGAGVVGAICTILLLLFGAALTAYVPETALAAVLIYIGAQIFRLGDIRHIARESRLEIVLVAIAILLVVLLPIDLGMTLSILLSLFYGLYVMLRPPCVELVHVPDTTIWWPPSKGEKGEHERGVVVFSPAAPLYFMNVRYIVERMNELVLEAPQAVRLLVVEGSGVIDIDYTGAHIFKSALRALLDRGITVALARLSDERAMTAAVRSGLIALIGERHVFKSADEAVTGLLPPQPR